MSTDLAFWRGRTTEKPRDVYLKLGESEQIDGLEPLDVEAVLAALGKEFAGWRHEANMWTYQPDEYGNGPSFDLSISEQGAIFTCYGLEHTQLNQIIDVMLGFDAPLYDPQLDERFA